MGITTDEYWDCECIENYIHLKSQWACPHCGHDQVEQPDSRIDEVLEKKSSYVLFSSVEADVSRDDCYGFWSNEFGYTTLGCATPFTWEESLDFGLKIPEGCSWVRLPLTLTTTKR